MDEEKKSEGVAGEKSEKKEKDPEPGVIKLPMVSIPVPRTFKALDKLAAYPLEGWLIKLDEKRKINIEAHIEAVRREEKTEAANDNSESIPLNEPSIETVDYLSKWLAHAEKHGDDEPELAAAWRAVLERIKRGDQHADVILNALSTLTSSDLRSFMRCLKHDNAANLSFELRRQSNGLATRLQGLGLIRDLFGSRFTTIVVPLWVIALLTYGSIYVFSLYTALGFSDLFPGISETAVIVMCATLGLGGLVVCYVTYLIRYCLTEAGQSFASSYAKYAAHYSKEQKSSAKAHK